MSEDAEKKPSQTPNNVEGEETPAETAPEAEVATEETSEEKPEKIEGLVAEVNETGPCKIEAKVSIPKAAIDAECAKTFDELTPNAAIPGFRKGHAPRRLVERHYQNTVLEEVKQQLIARSWEEVRSDNDLRPIGEPDLGDEQIDYDEEKGLSYQIEVEVAPTFELEDYKGLELTRPTSEVDEEEVETMLTNLAKRNAVLEPVEEGKTKQDDVPVVDCDITVGDEVIHSVSDQEITLGVDNWLRGLDEEFWKDLLGKQTGESASKTITLPDTYQKEEYRGKEGELTVTIKDIKRPKLPTIDDEFAKDMLYEDLDALKKEIRERLAGGKEREAHQALAKQVEEKLLAMVDFELPEELKARMTERTINRQRMDLAYQGVPRDEIEKATDQISQGAAERTEHDMRMYFILQQIAEKEDITVSESELERRIQMMARVQGQKPGKLRSDLQREGRLEILRSELRDEKTIDLLIAQAKTTEEDAGGAKKKAAKKPKKKAADKEETAEEDAGEA